MSRLISLVFAVSIVGASTAALAAPAPERVRGAVKSVSYTVLVVDTTSGSDETVNLTGAIGYLEVAKSNLGFERNVNSGYDPRVATQRLDPAAGPKSCALFAEAIVDVDEV